MTQIVSFLNCGINLIVGILWHESCCWLVVARILLASQRPASQQASKPACQPANWPPNHLLKAWDQIIQANPFESHNFSNTQPYLSKAFNPNRSSSHLIQLSNQLTLSVVYSHHRIQASRHIVQTNHVVKPSSQIIHSNVKIETSRRII